MNGLTYSDIRAAERREANRKRLHDSAHWIVAAAVYGAAVAVIVLFY